MVYGLDYPSPEELNMHLEYVDGAYTKQNGYSQFAALRRKTSFTDRLVFGTVKSKNSRAQFGWSKTGKRRLLYLHRVIWIMVRGEIPLGLVVDHISGNPRDNRVSNLRLATPSENQVNRNSSREGASCPYIGVCVSGNRFNAFVSNKTKPVYLGQFTSALEAAVARDEAALSAYGNVAKLNRDLFPEVEREFNMREGRS